MSQGSTALFERAQQHIPGGVNSPVRAFQSVGGEPRFIQSASGAYLQDADGRTLIDLIGSWGAMILGHAHPAVVEAVARTARDGLSFGTCHAGEVEMADLLCSRVPGLEQVRMVNSGTEAVMSALRLARAATGRAGIIKFAGGYHGHSDELLARAGSGLATQSSSAGVSVERVADTHVLPYNDLDAVQDCLGRRGDQIAAVIVEPVSGNMGLIPPGEGYLSGLRALTRKHGVLLILDEVMTGFRIAPGGAQERYNVQADLLTFGKVIGGGLPVGAYGGRKALLQQVAPLGPVYQAGTMSGNPVALAAGLATLKSLTPDTYQRLEASGARLEAELRSLLDRTETVGCVQRVGSMISVFFGQRLVRDFDDAQACNSQRFAAFFQAMLREGVHLPPSGFEAWFLSVAHDGAVLDRIVAAAERAMLATAPTGSRPE